MSIFKVREEIASPTAVEEVANFKVEMMANPKVDEVMAIQKQIGQM